MVEENIDVDATCFLDTNIDSFRVELLIMQKSKIPRPITQEVNESSDSDELWTMYFDGENSKEVVGVGVVFISPKKVTFRYSFTLMFTCTNNISEYETLFLRLRIAEKHKIRNLHDWGF